MMLDAIKVRFMARVLVDVVTGCWEWQGANDSRGYGKFWLGGRSRRAHRVAFRLWKRTPRAGYVLLHACDNPKCVNPGHLREGRQKTNVQDMWRKGRAAWQVLKAA